MKKKILAIFATALILALCAIPCFAYPSQNLTFGELYQNEDVTPYSVQEFRSDMQADEFCLVFNEINLSREITGFILKVEIPFLNGYGGDCYLSYEERYTEEYVDKSVVRVVSYSDQSSAFLFCTPRRGVHSIRLYIQLSDYYTFAPDDDSIVCTLYPISLNTSEIEETAYNSGFQGGYNEGLVDGQGVAEDLDGFLVDIFGALAEFFTPLLSVEIWGINLMSVVSLLVLVAIAMIVLSLKK